MKFRINNTSTTIFRSLLLCSTALAACRGSEAEVAGRAVAEARQAERSDGPPELHGRAISRGPSANAGRRIAAAVGVPLPVPGSTQFDITGFLQEAQSS